MSTKPTRPKVDWQRAAEFVRERLPVAKEHFDAFLREHPEWAGECEMETYPPRISISLRLPAPAKTRRKSVGAGAGGALYGFNVLVPTEGEVEVAASLAGRLADLAGLRPRRESERGDAVLDYALKPDFQQFEIRG